MGCSGSLKIFLDSSVGCSQSLEIYRFYSSVGCSEIFLDFSIEYLPSLMEHLVLDALKKIT